MIKQYRNGTYDVTIDLEDGTKVRSDPTNQFIPQFPESIDITISTKCNRECPFCYLGCSKQGKIGNLHQLASMKFHPYTEVSLNLNDPIPDGMTDLLYALVDQEVIPNVTIHSEQFVRDYRILRRWVDEKLVYGIGVSLDRPNDRLSLLLKTMPNAVVHAIAGIVSPIDLESVIGSKLLILGYKDTGRGKEYRTDSVRQSIYKLFEYMPAIFRMFPVVSFDNLAIEQLFVKSILSPIEWKRFYMGDEGDFTFSMNLVDNTYSSHSYSDQSFSMGTKTIDEMFADVRRNKRVLHT